MSDRMENQKVTFDYTNHKGVKSKRTVTPFGIKFVSNMYYKKKQWLMRAWCHERNDYRDFALNKIENFKEVKGEKDE